MSTATPIFGFRYPLGADSVNVPGDMKNLADDVEATLADAWTSYSAGWTGATTNPVIGNGTIAAAYKELGKTVHFSIVITMGSTTTYGSGTWQLTFPVAPSATGRPLFVGTARDTSASLSYWIGMEFTTAPSTGSLRVLPTAANGAMSSASPTVPFTWATTDVLTISGTYEAA